MDWYYAENDKQLGPFPEPEFQKFVDSGNITDDTLVWHEGMQEWSSFGSLIDDPNVVEQPAHVTPTNVFPVANEVVCSSCGKRVPENETIPYEGSTICGACKPKFFQRIQEGAPGSGGNTPNAQIMVNARAGLSGLWGISIGFLVIYQMINIVCQFIPIVGSFAGLLITGPMMVGSAIFFLSVTRGEAPNIGMMFHGFHRFKTTFFAYLLTILFTLLWMLLLVVPGIMAAYSYMMTFYIIADNESISAMEAINQSKHIMQGKRWKFFCLNMRFVGWSLLCLLTLGIGFLWLMPYITTSFACFYNDIKDR